MSRNHTPNIVKDYGQQEQFSFPICNDNTEETSAGAEI